MQTDIIKIDLSGEQVHLKKSFDGWSVVYPYRNEDGSLNWYNLITGGNLFKFIFMAITVLLILLVAFEYTKNLKLCSELINNQTLQVSKNYLTLP